ncbi:hypothetical protein E8E13_011220 [Curvularia kusanoi]|uniref:Peroxidase n=1 Tax=Curvularia kusanoi TaxID=90978 RepID=A0A9P4TMZ5_CURKU|nr:hypothetical protein E8E13_011220 [Curvularia kusanoi]
MKLSPIIVGGLGALTVFEFTYAHPGMASTIREIKERVQKRQERPGIRRLPRGQAAKVANTNKAVDPNAANNADTAGAADPPTAADLAAAAADAAAPDPIDAADTILIGDIKDGGSTPVGQAIARIITEQESGQSSVGGYQIPGQLGSAKCKADTCCVWAFVSMQLTNLFRGQSGRCNQYARAAIRLGFHDAGTWKDGLDFGGADGSIILAPEEISRPDNKGLQDIVRILGNLHRQNFKQYGVGVADFIQFAAKHAVVTCPLGPRIRTFVGRKDSSRANQDGLLPSVNDSADKLISLFQAKTIGPHELVALLGAHTVSTQNNVDPTRPNAPQDGTPNVWDTLFYNQTLGLGPLPKAVLRFPSDVVLAKDSRTKAEWAKFSLGPEGQSDWNEDYSYSYIRVSLLGVNNINNLTECTKVLPQRTTSFRNAGELLVAD